MVHLLKLVDKKTIELDESDSAQRSSNATSTTKLHGLTEREVEILAQLASGKTNQEIAATLYISEKTVHNHLSHIFPKLSVGNRTEAAKVAYQLGIALPETDVSRQE